MSKKISEDNMLNKNKSEKDNNALVFVKEVVKYFMDFLETDFHKRRTPRRCVKYKNESNLLVGVNLVKYPKFNEYVIKAFNNAFGNGDVTVKKGAYKTNIPKNLLDLVKIKVDDITDEDVNEIVNRVSLKLKKSAEIYSEEYDKALVSSLESATEIVKENLVLPFIKKIEKSLENLNLGDENSRYLMEEELTEVFVSNLENNISEVLKLLISNKEIDVESEIKTALASNDVKNLIIEFFEDFKIADLFAELLEINNNRNILDKQEFYFYFCDITFNKAKYPIFYIPFGIQVDGDKIDINFDSQVYINKKALEYIVQEFNKEKGKHGSLKYDTERIIYLAQGKDNLISISNRLICELVNYLELNNDIDIESTTKQKSRSSIMNISNSCYITLFDKSDEALVNDYEDILQLLSMEGGVLADIFHRLIDDFINKEPTSFNLELDDEWDDISTSDKLVIETPIPLNSEQRKIVSALDKKNCKYIAVQGPPGTGKSHTITAIICNTILTNKTVLVLSDKKEALDVVEDKITSAMNKVRNDKNFQNPILRLGKTGNTYSQILSINSIENIRNHYKAVKKNYKDLKDKIDKTTNSLKDDIEAESLIYSELNKKEIQELLAYEEYYKDKEIIVDINEIINNNDSINDIEEFRKIFLRFREIFGDNQKNKYTDFLSFFKISTDYFKDIKTFKDFIEYLSELESDIEELKNEFDENIYSIGIFKDFSKDQIVKLENFGEQYLELKNPVFGYLFKKKKVEKLNREFDKAFKVAKLDNPHKNIDLLESVYKIYKFIESIEKKKNNFDYIRFIHNLITNNKYQNTAAEYVKFLDDVKFIETKLDVYPKTFERIGFDINSFKNIYQNKLSASTDDEYNKLIRYLFLRQKITKSFNNIPRYSYINQLQRIEGLVTTQMTHLMDERLVNFYETNKATAKVLRDIIRKKQRFPRKEFSKLKEAFPCILAGIRDYAEYIPLEPEIFDLVIIDEASQVSIAQAFPALLRAKQVLILGDKKQFSNVKATQAKTDTNIQYLKGLEKAFRENISKEEIQIERLKKFNIKTSILEFFEYISNFNIQLRKHFRGYKELISFSNHIFYGDSLQVKKIRGKAIDDVLKFSIIDHDGKLEPIVKTNKPEVDFIVTELKKLRENGSKLNVGIITPHTNQQKMLIEAISKLPEKDYYFNDLKLKIMTFDTCQGEERDIIYLSMVATKEDDRLWGIFIKDLKSIDLEEEGKIRAQRLNVGFSRAKECMHFVLSKESKDFKHEIRNALLHYQHALDEAKKEPLPESVDKNSPMEKEVLNWLPQTKFWKNNSDKIELRPQFKMGKYLKQLDGNYDHPNYIVDFLLIYNEADNKRHNIIIEYDGFREHFTNREAINKFNFENHYSDDHVYRQKVLEGYGYKFIRLNKFNIGDNPIQSIDSRINELIKNNNSQDSFILNIHDTVQGLVNGDYKECPRCKDVKSKDDFKDDSLITGYGRFCRDCKKIPKRTKKPIDASGITIEYPESTDGKCPQCGSRMALRSGRYGKFHGCSKFPYCRGTRRYR